MLGEFSALPEGISHAELSENLNVRDEYERESRKSNLIMSLIATA